MHREESMFSHCVHVKGPYQNTCIMYYHYRQHKDSIILQSSCSTVYLTYCEEHSFSLSLHVTKMEMLIEFSLTWTISGDLTHTGYVCLVSFFAFKTRRKRSCNLEITMLPSHWRRKILPPSAGERGGNFNDSVFTIRLFYIPRYR